MDRELALIFDTETTKLTLHPDAPLHLQPKVIEFGGVLLSLDDGSVVDEVNILIDPGEAITAETTKITGITAETLAHAEKFEVVAPRIAEFFERAACSVAHNHPFDRAVIDAAAKRVSIVWPWPPRSLCTVGLYREEWGYQPKLTQLYEAKMGKPLAQTHRALDDVKALVEVIQKEEIWRLM